MVMRIGNSRGTVESFEETAIGGDTIVFGHDSTKRAASIGIGTIATFFIAWMFVYISGIFPYLGHETRSESYGLGASRGSDSKTFSLKRMLLIKGQRAFIDYDVRSSDGGGMILDIKPFYQPTFSPRMKTVKGDASGRYEMVVEQTGIYEFYHGFEIGAPSTTTLYTVTWGAV